MAADAQVEAAGSSQCHWGLGLDQGAQVAARGTRSGRGRRKYTGPGPGSGGVGCGTLNGGGRAGLPVLGPGFGGAGVGAQTVGDCTGSRPGIGSWVVASNGCALGSRAGSSG